MRIWEPSALMRNAMNFSLTRELDRWTERGYDRPHGRIQPDTPPSRHKDSTVTPVTLGVRRGCALPVRFRAEDSPRGLWRSLGKRVGCKPSRVRIPHPPPLVSTRKRRPDLTDPGGGSAAIVSVLVSVGLWPGPEEPADSARDLMPDGIGYMLVAGGHRRRGPAH